MAAQSQADADKNADLRGRWRFDGRWQCDCGAGMFSSSVGLYVGSHAASVSRRRRCGILRPLRSAPVSDNAENLTEAERLGRALVADYIARRIDFDAVRTGLEHLGFAEAEISEVVNTATMYRAAGVLPTT